MTRKQEQILLNLAVTALYHGLVPVASLNPADHPHHPGTRLIQLHRRATSRFKLYSAWVDDGEPRRRRVVLHIWLLYAAVLLRHRGADAGGDRNSATSTLKHVQRSCFGRRGPAFYGALAAPDEGADAVADADGTAALLRQAMDRGVSVAALVRDQMAALDRRGLLPEERTETGGGGTAPAAAAAPPSIGAAEGLPPDAREKRNGGAEGEGSEEKRTIPPETSRQSGPQLRLNRTRNTTYCDDNDGGQGGAAPKIPATTSSSLQRERQAVNAGVHHQSSAKNGGSSGVQTSLRAKLASRKRQRMAERTTPYPQRQVGGTGGLRAILAQTAEDSEDSEDDENDPLAAQRSAGSCAAGGDGDEPLAAVRSAGSCTAARGRSAKDEDGNGLFQDISPIDTEPTTSIKEMDLDYLLNWDPTKPREAAAASEKKKKKSVKIVENGAPRRKRQGAAVAKAVPKITRDSLGYMMNWDPGAKPGRRDEGEAVDGGGAAGVVVQQPAPGGRGKRNMSTIDEATEGSLTSGGRDNAALTSRSTGTSADSQGDHSSRHDSPREGTISAANLDCSFLPLIEKKNVISVEGAPYAKLGVIGKGGSCKVYRALSRDCDVVALKKVKLDGLNEASINGYANEIALLRRLKGNPAIIQLYSAEVDLARKSILLVMELGEVDLNYVLRQQELSSQDAGRSSLNMNFIRLTWQQMLTAVYSIHEGKRVVSSWLVHQFLLHLCSFLLSPTGVVVGTNGRTHHTQRLETCGKKGLLS